MRNFETIGTKVESGVLFATFDAPPMNLIGIAMSRSGSLARSGSRSHP